MAQSPIFDLADLKRRMQGAIQTLKHEFGGLRTGRATASLAGAGACRSLRAAHAAQCRWRRSASPSRARLSVQVWDKSMVGAVDKAIRDANLGLSPTVEGQILRIRIPELNEQRRKEMVKVAHK